MVCAVDYIINRIKTPCSILLTFFVAIRTLAELNKVYPEFAAEVHPFFLYYKSVKLHGQANSSGTAKQLFFNNMLLPDSNRRDNNEHSETIQLSVRIYLSCACENRLSLKCPPATIRPCSTTYLRPALSQCTSLLAQSCLRSWRDNFPRTIFVFYRRHFLD